MTIPATPDAQPSPAAGLAATARAHEDAHAGLALVHEALERLRFGAIQLTVHDGRLVQVDVTERTRFSAKS
jgi:hypothetical protein